MAQGNIYTDFQAAIDSGKILGGHCCATDSQGQFVFEKAFGTRTLLSGEKVPYKLDDVMYLASATKFLTAVAALKCVEDGILSLTGSLSKFAPELDAKQVIKGYDGETPVFEPQKQPITLEMLLTHSAGLSYPFIDERLKRWHEENAQSVKFPQKYLSVDERFEHPLVFQPGTDWMYGSGLDWAALVIERATGKPLADYLQEDVFKNLGINSLAFAPVTREDLRSRMVDLNPNDPEGLGIAVMGGSGDGSMNKYTRGSFGGHGGYMAAADYLKLQHSLLANDGKVLKPATVDSMFEQHLSAEAAQGHERAMATPPVGVFFRVGVPAGTKAGYGLSGLLTMEDLEGWFGEGTLTWGGGHTIAWFIDRKNDLCGFLAVQLPVPVVNQEIATTLKQVFREDVYRQRAAAAKQ